MGGLQYLTTSSHGPGMGQAFPSSLLLSDETSASSSWSAVFRLEPGGLLIPTQTIPTNFAYKLEHFAIGQRHFLLAPESRGETSSIYLWTELEGQLQGRGSATVNLSTGLAVFTDLAVDKIGSNYVLSFSLGPLLAYPASSGEFAVTLGPVRRIILGNQLAPSATAGVPLSVQPIVSLTDAGYLPISCFYFLFCGQCG